MDQRKRYQIFVSSTFADLEEERGKVMQTILNFDCFPAGMEMFPAMDEEIFEYIKRIIDDSNYYLLIIGGRYGSMSKDGVSWTEKEYDYAVSKGIPVIAFDHRDFKQLPAIKTDQDNKRRRKLIAFKKKVYKDKRIAYRKLWSNPDDLALAVATTLPRVFERQPSETGWVRADSIISEDSSEKIKKLQERIKELEASKDNQDWERLYQEDQDKFQQTEGTVDEQRTCPQMKDYSCFLTEEKIQNMITEAVRALVQSSLQKETKETESVFVPSDDTQIKPTETRKNNRVYISYRHTGKKDELDEKVASDIYDALVDRGYDCWMISRNLKDVGRDKWIQYIPEAIHKCNLFIIVLSKKSYINDRFFDWVFRSVKTAVEDRKLIKPFWIEALEEDDQKDPLKNYLRKYKVIDASGDYQEKIPELLNYVVGKLDAP